ncbi:MAG: hypothetical protein ABI113_01400 [Mucilaginibacter sp.]
MIITFGTRFYGKVAEHNGQWIESKFFSVMFIPIFPLSSIYVTRSEFNKRAGFNMDLNNTSVGAAYGRLLSFIMAAIFLFLSYAAWENSGYSDNKTGIVLFPVLAVACAALWVYFCFFYGKATLADIAMRNKVGFLTGFYALPHWFEYYQLTGFLKSFQDTYKLAYPDSDWKADLSGDRVPGEKHKLLFGIALFNCMVNNLPENDELYARADALYQAGI